MLHLCYKQNKQTHIKLLIAVQLFMRSIWRLRTYQIYWNNLHTA